MNKEYWNLLLLGKPRLLFYATGILFTTSAIWWCLDRNSGETVACLALIFAGLGWVKSMILQADGSMAAKVRTPWFGWMAWLLIVPIVSGEIQKFHGRPGFCLSRNLWETGKQMFGKEPPLLIRHERRSEMLGLETVELLIITNKLGEGIVPISGILKDAKHSVSVSLPPVLKPYETVEIRLETETKKVRTEKGDSLEIRCEGYSKPLIMVRE